MPNLVNRNDVMEEIARRDTTNGTVKVFSGQEIMGILDSCKQCDTEGKWLQTGEHHFCSECEAWALYDEYTQKEVLSMFCPSCGAAMENGVNYEE